MSYYNIARREEGGAAGGFGLGLGLGLGYG